MSGDPADSEVFDNAELMARLDALRKELFKRGDEYLAADVQDAMAYIGVLVATRGIVLWRR